MKITMVKWSAQDLIKSGYAGPVLVPVCDNMEGISGEMEIDIKSNKNRTAKQNSSIHKYCSILAKTLNDAGLDMKRTLKPDIDIPWTMESVKEYLWRPVQLAAIDKKSTTQLDTNEVSKVYNVLSRHLSEKFNINVSFPNRYGD